ncbi:MAG: hypothetical protein HRT89_12540 [Lentisphaeria bacterium]|nr:hypothetical protein [Lentisphaeria bacterium]
MSQDTFPADYKADIVKHDITVTVALAAMTYDVLAVIDENDRIISTITRTDIKRALHHGSTEETPIAEFMEDYDPLNAKVDREQELKDLFYVYVYAIINRQIQRKIFNTSLHDRFLNAVFIHIRKRVNQGKYDSCRDRMNFSHWLRTVINNKIIDELRKLPSEDRQESYRSNQEDKFSLGLDSPIRSINQADVLVIIKQAMVFLPEKQKIALLYSMENPDMHGKDQAMALDMTVNAFHLNLNRARDKMQKILTEKAPETVRSIKELRNRPTSR